MRGQNPQDTVVTHKITSVRKHFIDLSVPAPPNEDQETFVLRVKQANQPPVEVALHPGDLAQLLRCAGDSLARITNGVLWSFPENQTGLHLSDPEKKPESYPSDPAEPPVM